MAKLTGSCALSFGAPIGDHLGAFMTLGAAQPPTSNPLLATTVIISRRLFVTDPVLPARQISFGLSYRMLT